MSTVERLIEETLGTGELDQQLRSQFERWRSRWEFGEFREAILGRAWECRDQFRGKTAAEFFAWLRTIAWSVGVDHWRETQRQAGLLQRFASLLGFGASSPADRLETADLVEWLLAGLNERERKLLILKYFRHLHVDELATELNVSTAAVNQLHYRAIAKLRKRMEKHED